MGQRWLLAVQPWCVAAKSPEQCFGASKLTVRSREGRGYDDDSISGGGGARGGRSGAYDGKSVWWHSVPVGMEEERGRSSVERWRRCGLLSGLGCAFYRVRRRVLRQWGEAIEWPE
jgi:hypothetical protein